MECKQSERQVTSKRQGIEASSSRQFLKKSMGPLRCRWPGLHKECKSDLSTILSEDKEITCRANELQESQFH